MKKVRYIGDYYKVAFEPGKAYDVLEEDGFWYRIYCEFDDDGLFPKESFEIVYDDGRPVPPVSHRGSVEEDLNNGR